MPKGRRVPDVTTIMSRHMTGPGELQSAIHPVVRQNILQIAKLAYEKKG